MVNKKHENFNQISIFALSPSFNFLCKVKVSLHTSQVAHQAGAYPGFRGMKRLGIFLLPPGWDASLSQGYPQH